MQEYGEKKERRKFGKPLMNMTEECRGNKNCRANQSRGREVSNIQSGQSYKTLEKWKGKDGITINWKVAKGIIGNNLLGVLRKIWVEISD